MSQATKSRARARVRWRRQVARLIAFDAQHAERLLAGELTFDAHAARELALRIVAEGAKVGPHDREIIADYRYELGRRRVFAVQTHPRNRDGQKPISDLSVGIVGRMILNDRPGLPPGATPLEAVSHARTAQRLLDTLDGRCPWAPSAARQSTSCPNCPPVLIQRLSVAAGNARYRSDTPIALRGRTAHELVFLPTAITAPSAVDIQLVLTGPPGSVVGISINDASYLVSLGEVAGPQIRRLQLLVDECQQVVIKAQAVSTPCPDCHDTGHNRRASLPPVEWPAVFRRKVRDGDTGRVNHAGRHSDPLLALVSGNRMWREFQLPRPTGSVLTRYRLLEQRAGRPLANLDEAITYLGIFDKHDRLPRYLRALLAARKGRS